MVIKMKNVDFSKIFKKKYSEQKKIEIQLIVFSRFFLADVSFTFIPIAVIAILRASFGELNNSFWLIPEWPFASIIVYGLCMTRALELKIKYQQDTSEKVFALARMCILGLIASVVSLSLSQMKQYGLQVSSGLSGTPLTY
jgi:hypothetical protein